MDWLDPMKNMVWRGDQRRYVPYGQAFDGLRQMAPAGGWGPNRDAGGNWRGQGEPPQAAAARAAGLVTEDGINSPNGAAIAQEIATRRNELRTALQNRRMARAAELERRRGLYA